MNTQHFNDPRRSPWTVLFLGGPSGTGKSTLARRIAGRYGADILEADDIYLAVKAAADKRHFPAVFAWEDGKDWQKAGVEENIGWLFDVGKELFPAVREIALRHVEDELPVVIEGDFLHPEWISSILGTEIRALYIRETEREQIVRNYLEREGGSPQDYRAEISAAYGERLEKFCHGLGIPCMEARPWETALERAEERLLN